MSTPIYKFPYRDTTFYEFAKANKMSLGQAAKALEQLHRQKRLEVGKNRNGDYIYRDRSVAKV